MTIPFLDLRAAYRELKPEIDSAVARVLESGWYILGEEVEAFESEYARYVCARHCVGVGNGLDALLLGLKALGVGHSDEVIVPAHTFIATWLAVDEVGATPIPVDVDTSTNTIDVSKIEAAITPKTRAIIPVHLYGHPANLDPIARLARRYGIIVIEDAAQAHGAKYMGQRIGAHSDVVTWSFYPGKNLGAMGDGGAITTNNSDLAARLRKLRNYGSREKYVHEMRGMNSRLDPIQAAILRIKLQHLDDWNRRRDLIAREYLNSLSGLGLTLPVCAPWAEHAWHLYVVKHPERSRLIEGLSRAGVATMIHYPTPPHLQLTNEAKGFKKNDFPVTEATSDTALSLPIGPHLDRGHARYIAQQIRALIDA